MMEVKKLEQGIGRYGTPMYVFDLDEMQKTVGEFRTALEGKAKLCFAMKANPFLTRRMSEEVDRIEVCSMGEFRICRDLGLLPEKILISGVLKKREDLAEILSLWGNRCCYTVESLTQLQHFVQWCGVHGQKIRVYLRLTGGDQFGMDEGTIENVVMEREKYPFLSIQGIHYFSGTRKKSVTKMQKELAYLDDFCRKLGQRTGFTIKELEYGPGLSVPCFAGQEDTVCQDLRTLAQTISFMGWKGRIVLEMGRALAAACGYYLTSVMDVKENEETNYCIVDGGMHQLHYDGQIRGMYRPRFRMSPEREKGEQKEWTVCGALCTGNDLLMSKVPVSDLREGDVFLFAYAGAYSMTEGMALFLSHPLPKVALYDKKTGWKLIRHSQPTYQWNMEKEESDGDFDADFKEN